MKHINIVFEDDEFKKLDKKKDNLSWHDFILKLIEDKKEDDNRSN